MAKRVKVVVTSDRYGNETTGLEMERKLISRYPELDIDLQGAPARSEDELIRIGQDADVLLVSTREEVTRHVLENIPNVKVISRYGVGLDNVDLDAAADVGIVVTHYPGYCTSEVADHAMALLLAVNRRIVEQDRDLHEGAWQKYGSATGGILRGPVPPLRQLTLGIIGFGRIGQALADRARPFGLKLLVADPYVSPGTVEATGAALLHLDEMLPQVDLLTIHAPLTPETRGMINAERLSMMKPDASIINTARGPIIDLDALAEHLQEHPIARAALDVVYPEPLPAAHPLYMLPNVIHTPHSAYYSEQSVITVREETFAEAMAVLMGKMPRTVANPAVL
ncbi:MAG TPA: C-terminal binding protein, partial [Thermomicrobiales bacterium]|nr:C-terminal binding protein [Thermomicrobiales bacterium]